MDNQVVKFVEDIIERLDAARARMGDEDYYEVLLCLDTAIDDQLADIEDTMEL